MFDSPEQSAAEFDRDVLPHLGRVYRAALCLAGDQAEADELAQETFARACAAFGRLEPGIDVMTWLYRILVSTFASKPQPVSANGTDGRRPRPGSARRGGPTWPEIRAVAHLPDADVRRALRELPAESRIVVHLADVEGLAAGRSPTSRRRQPRR
jgi:RNA polymerase sigma-70 factor (ECF subfamily)